MLFLLPPSLPGHDRYYNKYINVKKGGIGGVAMLLTGYIALSYLWEYDHISKKPLFLFVINVSVLSEKKILKTQPLVFILLLNVFQE